MYVLQPGGQVLPIMLNFAIRRLLPENLNDIYDH